MAEASNPDDGGTLAAYIEKTDRLNDLVSKLLQKINGDNEAPQREGGGDHPNNNDRRGNSPPPHFEARSDNASQGEFVTREELLGLLKEK